MKKLYLLLAASLCVGMHGQAAKSKNPAHRAVSRATVAAPTPLDATDITTTGFTANWAAVPGASLYQVTVFEPITVDQDGTYSVLAEDFSTITKGNMTEPVFIDDWYFPLTDICEMSTPDWYGNVPVLAKGMIGGMLISPYIDLTNNGGRYTVRLGITGYADGMVRVTSSGTTEEKIDCVLPQNGYNLFELTFTNGSHDTYLIFTDYGIQPDPEGLYTDKYDFIDDVEFVQDLKAGDTFLRLVQIQETAEDSGVTSYRFDDMDYRNGATHLAYDVQAIKVTYNDPDDPYDYDVDYSPYSILQHVQLLAGVTDAEADACAPRLYNLQGVEVTGTPAPGIYISRRGNEASKVYIK